MYSHYEKWKEVVLFSEVENVLLTMGSGKRLSFSQR